MSQASYALPAGVTARTVETPRVATYLLESRPESGIPVLLIHGNVSSSLSSTTHWRHSRTATGGSPRTSGVTAAQGTRPLDATRSLPDFSDDLKALVDVLELGKVHPVGWSAGGTVAMLYAIDRPEGIASLTTIDPISLLSFGSTKDAKGTPCWPDYAASGDTYREEAISDCGHTPHVERLEEFRRIVFGSLGEHGGGLVP